MAVLRREDLQLWQHLVATTTVRAARLKPASGNDGNAMRAAMAMGKLYDLEECMHTIAMTHLSGWRPGWHSMKLCKNDRSKI